jgi:hypothetical protein
MALDPSEHIDPAIVKRITGLLNVNGRTPEEAASFLQKAHELLAKHNLEMDDIAKVGGVTKKAVIGEENIIIAGKFNWKKILIGVVADYFFCKAIIVTGTDMVSIIGRADNRAATRSMYRWIVQQMDSMAIKATARYQPLRRTDPSKQRWRNNYLHGANITIAQRLMAMRAQLQRDAEAKTTALAIRTQALVVQTRAENDEYTNANIGALRKSSLRTNRGRHGMDEGIRDGHRVDLNGPGRHLGHSSPSLTGRT